MNINWFWTHLDWIKSALYRPLEIPHWQGGTGGCWGATLCSAMEMRAMWQGYPPRQLSMAYSLYMDGRYDSNGSYVDAVMQDALEGICLESLMPMPAYAGIETWTPEYTKITWDVLQTAPSAAARADAPNQVVTDWGHLSYYGLADLKAQCQAALAAGYPLFVLTPTRTHIMCAMGCDEGGLSGPDSRSQNVDNQFYLEWHQIGGIEGVLRGVRFVGATMGTRPAMLPKPGTIFIPPPPPPTGNGPMLDTIISVAQAAKAVGNTVTQAQYDTLTASLAALVINTGAVVIPPPPPPPGTSPIGTTVPPAVSITDDLGAIWTIDAWSEVRRNGATVGGRFYASKLVWQPEERNGNLPCIAATNSGNGSVSFWDGSRWLWAGR